jgi:hypothetical protein
VFGSDFDLRGRRWQPLVSSSAATAHTLHAVRKEEVLIVRHFIGERTVFRNSQGTG